MASVASENNTGWTIATYAAHNEALREADVRFHEERDKRYEERHRASKEAVAIDSVNAVRLAAKIESSLDEYKVVNNEWRKTVGDLIAVQQGRTGITDPIKALLYAVGGGVITFLILQAIGKGG